MFRDGNQGNDTNTNALNFITSVGIAPHLPLSPAGRGEGEGAHCQKTKRGCISKKPKALCYLSTKHLGFIF